MSKTLSVYAGAFIITLVGAAATMLIVDTAYSVEDFAFVPDASAAYAQ